MSSRGLEAERARAMPVEPDPVGSNGRARETDEILTSREARELLKVGRTKLWELTRGSVIPAYRIGRGRNAELRYKRSELLAWLDQNRI